jgi:hypothetical protein
MLHFRVSMGGQVRVSWFGHPDVRDWPPALLSTTLLELWRALDGGLRRRSRRCVLVGLLGLATSSEVVVEEETAVVVAVRVCRCREQEVTERDD